MPQFVREHRGQIVDVGFVATLRHIAPVEQRKRTRPIQHDIGVHDASARFFECHGRHRERPILGEPIVVQVDSRDSIGSGNDGRHTAHETNARHLGPHTPRQGGDAQRLVQRLPPKTPIEGRIDPKHDLGGPLPSDWMPGLGALQFVAMRHRSETQQGPPHRHEEPTVKEETHRPRRTVPEPPPEPAVRATMPPCRPTSPATPSSRRRPAASKRPDGSANGGLPVDAARCTRPGPWHVGGPNAPCPCSTT